MWGLIVGVALGGLLLMTAVTTLRTGELRLGDRIYRRGERRFGVAVGLLGAAGVAAAGWAVLGAAAADEPRLETISVPGFSLVVEGDWSEREALPEGAPSERDLGVVAYASADGELVLTWRRAASDQSPEQLLDSLRQPDLRYDRWEASTVDGVAAVDMVYASPRGVVRARAMAHREGERELRWVLATCTHDGRGGRCEDAVTSLRASRRGPSPASPPGSVIP